MGVVSLQKGEFLHKAGTEKVSSIEVILKGKLSLSDKNTKLVLGVGSIIGTAEKPGEDYKYNYEALEDCNVFSYAYNCEDDIPNVIRSNPKIAPILASQAVNLTLQFFNEYERLYGVVLNEYKKVQSDYAEYNTLCIKAGETPKQFDDFTRIPAPKKENERYAWQYAFVKGVKENEENLKKNLYGLGTDIASGVVMMSLNHQLEFVELLGNLDDYRKDFKKTTANFTATMNLINSKINGTATEGGEGVVITNALTTILSYAGVSPEITSKFEEQIEEFKKSSNRYDSSDTARALRRDIGNTFYEVFTPAFKKAAESDDYPIEVKMFFMFGFVDEELAGEKNTAILYNMAKAYVPDPDGNVLTMFEWLKKVYEMEVDPSKNEFDQDWPTYLREQKTAGDISQKQAEELLNDPVARLEFEIKNLFSLGNRVTFGRISSFVPIFDEENVIRPLDMAYVTTQKVNGYFENIRNIDFGVFCRQSVYSNANIGIPQLYYAKDVTPYMILLPNVGSRASLWQEIEGKKRDTKARMLVSIFNVENTDDVMLRLFAEFRWEMCKTEQGVHWNDVRDPSLTSLYCDYLQFFKKNSNLSTENKEKVKTDLKKFSNNFKNMFISDYMMYIKFESNNSPRLNRVAREILFNFCPFKREIREKMMDNPQYTELMARYSKQSMGQLKPLMNLLTKIEKEGITPPKELTDQIDYLER
ncbi:MAG: hypothetical protein K6F37_04020 [Lachnospiraceae bacterium]|nr:hypothetical protein [Lachnospiraceae bacterium]